jgi:hypothetical protein
VQPSKNLSTKPLYQPHPNRKGLEKRQLRQRGIRHMLQLYYTMTNTENLNYRLVYIPDSDDYILAYQFGEGEGFNNSSFYNAKTGCLINDGGSND